MLFGWGQVVGNYFFKHLLRGDFWHPARFSLGLAGVAEQGNSFGVAEVSGVDAAGIGYGDF